MSQTPSRMPETEHDSLLFSPESPANQQLRKLVAPEDWQNPEPSGRYNLVVIGAGSGGLVTAAGAAGLGAKGFGLTGNAHDSSDD